MARWRRASQASKPSKSVAGASGVEAGGDAVEVGLVGDAGGERGDLGFEQQPHLHDLGGAGVGGRAVDLARDGLGEERAASDVAGDQPLVFEVLQGAADGGAGRGRAARPGRVRWAAWTPDPGCRSRRPRPGARAATSRRHHADQSSPIRDQSRPMTTPSQSRPGLSTGRGRPRTVGLVSYWSILVQIGAAMKLVTFTTGGASPRSGRRRRARRVRDVTALLPPGTGVLELIEGWASWGPVLRRDDTGPARDRAGRGAAARRRSRRRGATSSASARTTASTWPSSAAAATTSPTARRTCPSTPIVFTKATTSVDRPVRRHRPAPGVTRELDYEAELGVIIGRGGRGISRERGASTTCGATRSSTTSRPGTCSATTSSGCSASRWTPTARWAPTR